jgi:hypothetical protein
MEEMPVCVILPLNSGALYFRPRPGDITPSK